jgi:hypothetical protein
MSDALLDAIENLSRFHREHEKFYAQDPRCQAVLLQRHSRSLCALADRWSTIEPDNQTALNPYEGCVDLNASESIQLDGILFMEGQGEPVEITRIKRDVRTVAADSIETGDWLAAAMEATWAGATGLFAYPELASAIGDRHRIIANDWQAANMSTLAGLAAERGADLLDHVDFSPEELRADLAARRVTPRLIYSAIELIDRAADLLSDSAALVHDNERRWRNFRSQLADVRADIST